MLIQINGGGGIGLKHCPNYNKGNNKIILKHSLKKRYLFRVFTNLLSFPISIITQSIIPRALGPVNYGDYGFLTGLFSQFISFFDSGASTCFYTKLSQRQDDNGLVKFYFSFVIAISLLLILIVVSIFIFSARSIVWPEQEVKFIWMALFWGLLTWYSQELQRMIDAYGLTVDGEIVNMIQKILGVSLILILFLVNFINLFTFFIYNYVILLFLAVGWIVVLRKNGSLFLGARLSKKQFTEYGKEFINYSMPLFVYSTIGAIAAISDRWFLQTFAGSIQQGFYWLSFQIGAVCFIFTGAMTSLITREFSLAFSERDIDKIRVLFERIIPLMSLLAAYIAIFVAFEADKIVLLVGGNKFGEAKIALTIMAFYPIHQTYGQLSSSLYFATGQTRLYRNIGISFLLLGLPFMYFLVAPAKYFGLDLGAEGLAIKMVTLQIISVNISIWYNIKYLNLSFKKFVNHQIYSLLILAVLAYFSVLISDNIFDNTIFSLILGGFIYTAMFIIILYIIPSLGSTTREEMKSLIRDIFLKIK